MRAKPMPTNRAQRRRLWIFQAAKKRAIPKPENKGNTK